jgi:hypothetical protein
MVGLNGVPQTDQKSEQKDRTHRAAPHRFDLFYYRFVVPAAAPESNAFPEQKGAVLVKRFGGIYRRTAAAA